MGLEDELKRVFDSATEKSLERWKQCAFEEYMKSLSLERELSMYKTATRQWMLAILATVGPLRIPKNLFNDPKIQSRSYAMTEEDGVVTLKFVAAEAPKDVQNADITKIH